VSKAYLTPEFVLPLLQRTLAWKANPWSRVVQNKNPFARGRCNFSGNPVGAIPDNPLLFSTEMKLAIQGELGSFSHDAAIQFEPRAVVVPCARCSDVFDALDSAAVQVAAIAIENSLAGSVAENYDLLLKRDAFIHRELLLRIRHNLIAPPGTRIADVRRVFSHPVALEQCRSLFRSHPALRAIPFYDTAGSVRHVVAEKLSDRAAIAPKRAAALYGGKILLADIEDDRQNFTRFLLISKRNKKLPGANKTSLAFALRNVPGALFKALSVFALRDISLSKIESRPIVGHPWEYVFFADINHGHDEAAQNAIRHLGEIAEFVKVLGVYRAAIQPKSGKTHKRRK
jgi:prephenate dehydratase